MADNIGYKYIINDGGHFKDSLDENEFKKSLTQAQINFVDRHNFFKKQKGNQTLENVAQVEVKKASQFVKKFTGCCQGHSLLYAYMRVENPHLTGLECWRNFYSLMEHNMDNIAKFMMYFTSKVHHNNLDLLDAVISKAYHQAQSKHRSSYMPNLNEVMNVLVEANQAETGSKKPMFPPLPKKPEFKL